MSRLAMAEDNTFDEVPAESRTSSSRPTLSQVKAIISFMEKHRDLAKKKHKHNSLPKFKKLWTELSDTVNLIEGCEKSTQGWIKFWADKKRFLLTKQRQIEDGKVKSTLTALEQRILDLCEKKTYTPRKKRKPVKDETCNGEDEELEIHDVFMKGEDFNGIENRINTEADERQLTMFEKMVEVMDQQSSAMSQLAQASLTNSKALARLAEASHVQAAAVERLVTTFESISSSAQEMRNAILGIDYTLKRVYPATNAQRPNPALFS